MEKLNKTKFTLGAPITEELVRWLIITEITPNKEVVTKLNPALVSLISYDAANETICYSYNRENCVIKLSSPKDLSEFIDIVATAKYEARTLYPLKGIRSSLRHEFVAEADRNGADIKEYKGLLEWTRLNDNDTTASMWIDPLLVTYPGYSEVSGRMTFMYEGNGPINSMAPEEVYLKLESFVKDANQEIDAGKRIKSSPNYVGLA